MMHYTLCIEIEDLLSIPQTPRLTSSLVAGRPSRFTARWFSSPLQFRAAAGAGAGAGASTQPRRASTTAKGSACSRRTRLRPRKHSTTSYGLKKNRFREAVASIIIGLQAYFEPISSDI